MRTAPIILCAILLAGCLDPTGQPDAPMAACLSSDPMDHGADDETLHLDPALHAYDCNVTKTSHLSLADQGANAGAHSVVTHAERGLAAVALRSGGEGMGVDLVDIEADMPEVVGSLRSSRVSGGDRNTAFSDDGLWLFMGGEGEEPDRAGVHVIDISDPSVPALSVAGFWPLKPFGVHTLEAFSWQGTQYVAAINFGVNLLRFEADPAPHLVPVSKLMLASERVASHPSLSHTSVTRDLYGHDAHIAEDPATGALLLTYAGIYEGTAVYDISDPASPQEILRWIPPAPEQPSISHYAMLHWTEDGRRILINGEETFESRHAGRPSMIWFVDVTDWDAPAVLAEWSNPGGHSAGRLLFSVHYFEVRDNLMAVAHYHGGIWLLNIEDPARPTEVGYAMPAHDTGYRPPGGCCLGYDMMGMPMTFDVHWGSDGRLWAADFATGLYGYEVGA